MSHRHAGLALVLVLVLALPAAASGAGCAPIDPSACLLPWPNDHFTRHDASSPTGLRLALGPTTTPTRKDDGKHVDVSDLNRADGFSPGGFAIVRVPQVTSDAALERSHAATMAHPERWSAKAAPLVLADAKTGKRWPAVTEVDSVATTDAERALLIRPLRNLREGHRYVIALRNLRTASGAPVRAGAAFAKLHRPRVFAELARAGV